MNSLFAIELPRSLPHSGLMRISLGRFARHRVGLWVANLNPANSAWEPMEKAGSGARLEAEFAANGRRNGCLSLEGDLHRVGNARFGIAPQVGKRTPPRVNSPRLECCRSFGVVSEVNPGDCLGHPQNLSPQDPSEFPERHSWILLQRFLGRPSSKRDREPSVGGRTCREAQDARSA